MHEHGLGPEHGERWLDMASYYADTAGEFRLERAGPMPLRNAQLGALHAIAAHFTRYQSEAIVAVPTGVGKTVVAVAAPHVLETRGRVLVVVPSRVLRRQTVDAFRHQDQLRQVGVLPAGTTNPVVVELDEIPSSWSVVEDADVVVALPQSLGPLLERETPPRDLFEVVVFDEAHHTPANSWTDVRTAFDASMVLLTATPYRRDLRELPGRLAYEYPLSHAIADGVYTPVEFVGVETIGLAEADIDQRIAERAVDLLRGELHAGTSSRLLVRAKTKQRVDQLAALYRELDTIINVVRGDLTPATVENRIDQVRRGEADGLAFVGVLGEGFDCPELKIGAYHDKHRSLPVTMQFIGRLSRQSATAGPAQVVAAYDTLRSDTWELYRSDSVWADLVPRLAERATSDVERRKQLLERMPPFPHDDVSLHDICLRIGVGIFTADDLEFDLTHDQPADLGLDVDSRFAHGNIVWAHVDTHEQLLMIVTQHRDRPDWIRTPVLDAARYEMHVVLLRPDEAGRPLIVVSSSSRDNEYRLAARVAGAPDRIKLADVEFMRRFLGVAEIQAVQHLGTRNTSAGSQAMSYTTRAGSSVEDGTYSEDLRDDVVGHVGTTCMIQGEPYCAGVSLGRSRIWVNKFFPIDRYIEFIDRLLIAMGAGQPGNIRRLRTRFEVSLHHWPDHTDVLTVANHPDLTAEAISIAGRAQARVRAPAVAEVLVRRAIESQAGGIRELRGVTVGGREQQGHGVAGPDRDPADLVVLHGDAAGALNRPVVADELLRPGPQQRGTVLHRRQRFGVGQKGVHRVADGGDHRAVAALEHHPALCSAGTDPARHRPRRAPGHGPGGPPGHWSGTRTPPSRRAAPGRSDPARRQTGPGPRPCRA